MLTSSKIHYWGIIFVCHCPLFFLFGSFLRGVQQIHLSWNTLYVVKSYRSTNTCDVPQGSITNSLFFILYQNALRCGLKYLKVNLFADVRTFAEYNSLAGLSEEVNTYLRKAVKSFQFNIILSQACPQKLIPIYEKLSSCSNLKYIL